jgi:hypothetical protein
MRREVTPDAIAELLPGVLLHGARAPWLKRDNRELVLMLCPEDRYPGLGDLMRAEIAEDLMRQACRRIDAPTGEALSVLVGLAAGTLLKKLGEREEEAAKMLGITIHTIRREPKRSMLLELLAVELHRIITDAETPPQTDATLTA